MLSISGAIFAISKRLCLCAKPKRNPLCQSKILKKFPSRYFQIADQPGRRALQNCSRMRLFRHPTPEYDFAEYKTAELDFAEYKTAELDFAEYKTAEYDFAEYKIG